MSDDTKLNKLNAEISRRECELRECSNHGYSAYNDYLEIKIQYMKSERDKIIRGSQAYGYSAFV